LVDGNLSAPNLGLHLDIVKPKITLHHALRGDAHIKDAIYSKGNLDVVPSSLLDGFRVNPLKLRDKIKNVKKRYDIILLDSSPSLNEETLGVMNASDSIFVVTTPDYPTLGTTLKAVKLARQRGAPIDGLIINKVHGKNFELSTDVMESIADVPVMAVIPHDVNVLKALSEVTPTTSYAPRSGCSEEYRKLAATLIGQKYNPRNFRRFFRLVKGPKKEEINRELFYDRVFK